MPNGTIIHRAVRAVIHRALPPFLSVIDSWTAAGEGEGIETHRPP